MLSNLMYFILPIKREVKKEKKEAEMPSYAGRITPMPIYQQIKWSSENLKTIVSNTLLLSVISSDSKALKFKPIFNIFTGFLLL